MLRFDIVVEGPVMVANPRRLVFRYIVAGTFFAFGVFPSEKSGAQTQQQIEWCRNGGNLFSRDLQISGCTAVIQSSRRSAKELPWALINRAYAYYKKDEYQEAIADFSEAIRLDPADAHALNGRCWMRAIVGRELRQALEDCNESLRLRIDDAATLDSRGFTCLKLGQFNHAISDYDAALALDPNQAESYYGRGVAKLKKGDNTAGATDIAAAKAIQADVAEEFAKYGLRLENGIVSIPPVNGITGADCARAVAHQKSVEDIRTLAFHEDHFTRFVNLH
jgi:tetratricopeptide (TPR) repeat protein